MCFIINTYNSRVRGEPANIIMTNNVVVKVTGVQKYVNADTTYFRLSFDTAIDGIARNDENEYVSGKVNYIDYSRKALIANLAKVVEDFDLAYSAVIDQVSIDPSAVGFGASQALILLKGAKLTIDRTPYAQGQEYTKEDGTPGVHDFAGFNKTIIKAELTTRGNDWIAAKIATI